MHEASSTHENDTSSTPPQEPRALPLATGSGVHVSHCASGEMAANAREPQAKSTYQAKSTHGKSPSVSSPSQRPVHLATLPPLLCCLGFAASRVFPIQVPGSMRGQIRLSIKSSACNLFCILPCRSPLCILSRSISRTLPRILCTQSLLRLAAARRPELSRQ
jgi:hypothetical protein